MADQNYKKEERHRLSWMNPCPRKIDSKRSDKQDLCGCPSELGLKQKPLLKHSSPFVAATDSLKITHGSHEVHSQEVFACLSFSASSVYFQPEMQKEFGPVFLVFSSKPQAMNMKYFEVAFYCFTTFAEDTWLCKATAGHMITINIIKCLQVHTAKLTLLVPQKTVLR